MIEISPNLDSEVADCDARNGGIGRVGTCEIIAKYGKNLLNRIVPVSAATGDLHL